jgi:exodeoxyribonuclease-3
MKLMSWNVNGIRAALKKGFMDFFEEESPDILCLQETRALPEQVSIDTNGYHIFWNPAKRKGYSGTAILTKKEPLSVRLNLGYPEHDDEGRVLTAEYEDYFLVTVYTPNSKRGLERLEYRTLEWDPTFRTYLQELEKDKPVIFCGDLNVAHKEIDLANPKSNERNAGFTIEERTTFEQLLNCGFIDTFREFCSEGGHYTWWSNFGKAREKNIGWRIDYFCISPQLRSRLRSATILPHIMGSDHCPVAIELE